MQEQVQPNSVEHKSTKRLNLRQVKWGIIGILLLLTAIGIYMINTFRSQGDVLQNANEDAQQRQESDQSETPLPDPGEYTPPEELPFM